MRQLAAGLLLSLTTLLFAGPAAAVGDVHFTETWLSPGDSGWEIDDFHWFSPTYELFDLAPSVISEEIFEGDVFVGWNVEVTVPNIVDPLPTKHVKVLVEGFNPGSSTLPSVLSIVATDTLFGGGPTTTTVCPRECELLSSGTFFASGNNQGEPGEPLSYFEIWEMHPNPDWETVEVFIPAEFEPSAFHITTHSIPEPGTLVLASGGLVGLLVAGRRRRA